MPSGKYTFWIDPAHGYNIAKGTTVQREGDIIAGHKLQGERKSSYEVVRFEKIGDVWLPMEILHFV